jgi:hypothetical protein
MFSRLLALFPADTLSDGEIILINYEKIWEDAGINFNPRNETRINREEILDIALSSLSEHIAGDSAMEFSSFYSGNDGTIKISPIEYDTLGYDIAADVDAEIIHGSAWDNNLMIGMSGDFTVKTTRSALHNQDGWPQWVRDNFQTEIYREIPVYSWGPSTDAVFRDGLKPPHLDYWGIARPLAATNGNMLVADSVDLVKGMIDALTDASPSLADIPEYALIAEYMDYFGVYAVIMSKTMIPIEQYELLLPLQQFLAVGFGNGKDERGNYTAVIAVYENEDLAQESAGILEERLRETAIALDVEIEFTFIQWEGRVLYAKLYVDEVSLGLNWLYIVRSYLHND